MAIRDIQNILIQEVNDKIHYFVTVIWDNNMGLINVLTQKYKLIEKISELSKNYTNYYGGEYKVKEIIITEKINRNPHIKIKL